MPAALVTTAADIALCSKSILPFWPPSHYRAISTAHEIVLQQDFFASIVKILFSDAFALMEPKLSGPGWSLRRDCWD